MVVIAIIGIIAAIAIPNFISYRKRSLNSTANADAKNAYTAAQGYFADHDEGQTIDLDSMKSYGFTQSQNVTVTCAGTQGSLAITALHTQGDKTYSVNSIGGITISS